MYNVYKYIRMMLNKKVIVDCDGGTDDAVSLVILLNAHKQNLIELTAITCVAGNTDIENVVKNVFRILKLCEIDVPVYKGANSSLISLESILVKAADFKYHGNDGFGDVLQEEVDISNLRKEHAVIALKKIITDNPDQVSVVCLGPLTNIALAIKIYPEILDSVKDFYVMGGNSMGLGNTTSQAEFNFYADPESVHMFLRSNTKPLWIFPWETCLKTYIPMDWREEISLKAGSQEKMKLITEIEDGAYKNKDKREYYCPCDAFCAAAVVNSSVIKRYEECHMDVELHGIKTRGQSVIDHLKDKKPNVLLVNEIDIEEFKTIMFQAFQ